MTLKYVSLSGALSDGSGSPAVSGTLTFWPSAWLSDSVSTVFPPSPVTVPLSATGEFSVALLATDNDEPPSGTWLWNVRAVIPGTPVRMFAFALEYAEGAEQDFAAVIPVPPADVLSSYTAGGDLSGTFPDPEVTATHLASPLPLAQGGTGSGTQQGAINALTGSQSAGKYLRSDGTNAALAPIQASDVPTLNQNTTGTAAGLSATLPIASGGTGQVTRQAAVNALTGTQSAGAYLRSDGTNSSLSAIQAADVPAATTGAQGAVKLAGDLAGTATSPQVTGTHLAAPLPLAQGGTGSATQNFAGLLAMTAVKTSGYSAAPGDYVRADATSASLTVTLPSAPATLTTIGVKMTGTASTNTVTVQCQGSDVLNKTGGSTTYTLSLLNQGAVFQYSVGGIWLVTGDNLSLGQLDARYSPINVLDGVTVTGTPTSGQVPTATSGTAATWQTPSGGGGGGIAPPAGDIGGTAGSPTVVSTHLSSALPVAQGGTGAATLTGLVTGNGTSAMTAVAAPSGTVVGTTDTQTLTAKRINPRVATLTVSGSTYTPAGDTTDLALIASPSANFTVAAPSGTPVDGQRLLLRVTSGGTGFTPTWNAIYFSSGVATLPSGALPASKTCSFEFIYDPAKTGWILMAADATGY